MRGRVCLIVAAGLGLGAAADRAAPPGQSAAAAPRCIQRTLVASPVALPDGRVYFRGRPDPTKSYIARFKGKPCAGLDRFSILTVETTGVGYCAGDKVRAYRDATRIEGPACVIDRFEPVDGRAL